MASAGISPGGGGGGGDGGGGDDRGGRGIRLFGTLVSLPQEEPHHQQEPGEALPADGAATPNSRGRWTEEEHRAFLKWLAENGRGSWQVISSEFVKTRTPRQVLTHSQKYFLHQARPVKRRRGLFDITLDSETHHPPPPPPPPPPTGGAVGSRGLPDPPLPG